MKLRTEICHRCNSFCDSLKANKASSVITYQLVKSATSTGANYRAACRARSKKEFFSKICIVVEEADESEYWLEIIRDAGLSRNLITLEKMRKKPGDYQNYGFSEKSIYSAILNYLAL